MKNQDIIIDEIRKNRLETEEKLHNDPDEIFAYLIKVQEKFKDLLVKSKNNNLILSKD